MVLNDNEVYSFKTFEYILLNGDMGTFNKVLKLTKLLSQSQSVLDGIAQPPKHHRFRFVVKITRLVVLACKEGGSRD